ncbi:MAG: hypothetical protein M5U01_35420 [Ardenticatenaceae bacterium]|nr:hypothetical protein [Ardenticatenaceae bacterium]
MTVEIALILLLIIVLLGGLIRFTLYALRLWLTLWFTRLLLGYLASLATVAEADATPPPSGCGAPLLMLVIALGAIIVLLLPLLS